MVTEGRREGRGEMQELMREITRRHGHQPSGDDTVTFAIQDGGARGRHVTPSLLEMRVLLSKFCRGPYSPDVRQFAYLVRLDGEFVQWNFEGCERLRRSFKEGYIQIDLGIPIHQWNLVTEREFREYVMSCVLAGAIMWIERLRRDKTVMNGEAFLRDLQLVKRAFLPDGPASL